MLILSRKVGQVITIGEDAGVTVTILGCKGGQVKVGVNAPKDIPVHRQEIYQQIYELKIPHKKKKQNGE